MDKTTDEKSIITLYSIEELVYFLKQNEGSVISVQIELDEAAVPLKQGGDGSG